MTKTVNCEQNHCSESALNEGDYQYFCVKCNMELCGICIHEHKTGTSISGLTCDNEICYGSRSENV